MRRVIRKEFTSLFPAVAAFLLLAAPSPALAHGGEGILLGAAFSGFLIAFLLVVAGFALGSGAGILAIFVYVCRWFLQLRRGERRPFRWFVLLLLPVLCVVFGISSFIGSMWYYHFTHSAAQEQAVPPPPETPPR